MPGNDTKAKHPTVKMLCSQRLFMCKGDMSLFFLGGGGPKIAGLIFVHERRRGGSFAQCECLYGLDILQAPIMGKTKYEYLMFTGVVQCHLTQFLRNVLQYFFQFSLQFFVHISIANEHAPKEWRPHIDFYWIFVGSHTFLIANAQSPF